MQQITSEHASTNKNKHLLEYWPAPGSEDTELGVLMELEVGHGETRKEFKLEAVRLITSKK